MKIIKFNAIWCLGCLTMKQIWKQITEQYPNIDIIDYDYDQDEDMVMKYNVGSTIPVMIFIKDNKEVIRLEGEKNKQEIIKVIESIIND